MRRKEIIVGLDVGTTKICAVVGEANNDRIDILSVGRAPSKGLRKGVVTNIDMTVDSIRKAVSDAESNAGVEIRSVYVGIAGGHIKSFSSFGAAGIKNREVSELDIEKAIEAAKAVYVPLDREVLHVIPSEHSIDGQSGIMKPIGMSGVRLETKVQIITGAVSAVQNLIKCCEKAGLQVNDIILEPLASSVAVLSEEEKEHGVILVDIGGGTTDITFYDKGALRNTTVIAVGGDHVTNDISVGLRLPLQEAERVKREFASAIPMGDEKDEIEIKVAGRDVQLIPKQYLTEIVSPRCEELLNIIKGEIERFGAYELAKYGVVLTGGASMLKGLDTMTEAMLGLPVRVSGPEGVGGLKNVISDPMYSTGVGLTLYALENHGEKMVYVDLFTAIMDRMRNWVKGVFRKKELMTIKT
ncbi:MAG: cell division protein FtsA [Nitrospirota bacterium]|nr:MAG: cell division protein FtsA [Nitrospirota bacterium]